MTMVEGVIGDWGRTEPVFGRSPRCCGGKLQIRGIMGIVAVTWMWDPGGGALDILAFVLLPAGT